MQTKRCPTRQEFADYDSGILAAERHDEITSHLDECADCAAVLESLEEPADELIGRLREKLPAEILTDDSELHRLVDTVKNLGDTSIAARAETQEVDKHRRKASVEELVAQCLGPAEAAGELGRLGGYRVLRVLGKGGMGIVCQAEDSALKRLVALKVMNPASSSVASRGRFLREAQAMAAVHHDNVVTIFQVGEDRGAPFLAMELLEGQSLADRLRAENKLSVIEALRIARETARGLAAAHARGLTHRDIKPDNIWLESSRLASRDVGGNAAGGRIPSDAEGQNEAGAAGGLPVAGRQGYGERQGDRVKILDFGLARAADEQGNLTESGAIVGTPNYLAPEQVLGGDVDARTDLFSLGVVLYEMLTGEKPFQRDSLIATLRAIDSDTPPTPVSLRGDVPQALSGLVMKLLEKDPARRPASTAELIRAIRTIEETPREPAVLPAARKVPPRRRTLIATAAAAAMLLLMVGVIVTVRDKDGKILARIFVRDGATVTVSTGTGDGDTSKTPVAPKDTSRVAPISTDHLPPMTPAALVPRPPKLTTKDSEPVLSWTIATTYKLGSNGDYAACSLHPDGQRLAVFGEDGCVRVWDVELKRLIQVLVGHATGPASTRPNGSPWYRTNSRRFGPIAWQPKGSLLATASRDGSVRVWNVDSGQVVFEQPGAAGDLNMVSWSPDGSKLAAGYVSSGTVRCWNANDWKALKSLDGLTSGPGGLDWSPDSSTLAVMANVVLLYTPADGAFRVVKGATSGDRHGTMAPKVRWSPDGTRLTYFQGPDVVIAEAGSLKEVRRLRRDGAKTADPVDFAWSPDSRQVLVAWGVDGKDEQLIYEAETGAVAHSFSFAVTYGAGHHSVEWLPDGRTIVFDAKLIDIESKGVLGAFNQFHESSNDGTRLLGTDVNNGFPVLNFDKPGEKSRGMFIPGAQQPTTNPAVVWSPDGQFLSLGNDYGQQMLQWKEPLSPAHYFTFPEAIVGWSPDGKLALVNTRSGAKEVWSWEKREKVHSLPLAADAFAWSRDGGALVVASYKAEPAQLVQFDVRHEILRDLWKVDQPIFSMAWSNDGTRIAARGQGGTFRVYSATDGSQLAKFTFVRDGSSPYYGFGALFWSPDEKRVAVAVEDALLLYDPSDGRLIREFNVGVAGKAWRFSDDSTLLLATKRGKVVRLNLTTGAQEDVISFQGTAVEFSPDAAYLASDWANVRRIIRLADGDTVVSLATQQALVSPDGHVWTPDEPRGSAWAVAPSIASHFVYIVQTASGQQTLTPLEFANRYGWQNDPSQVRLK
jgi:serine/threonine protein kinase/Tol biopolymer transport system component